MIYEYISCMDKTIQFILSREAYGDHRTVDAYLRKLAYNAPILQDVAYAPIAGGAAVGARFLQVRTQIFNTLTAMRQQGLNVPLNENIVGELTKSALSGKNWVSELRQLFSRSGNTAALNALNKMKGVGSLAEEAGSLINTARQVGYSTSDISSLLTQKIQQHGSLMIEDIVEIARQTGSSKEAISNVLKYMVKNKIIAPRQLQKIWKGLQQVSLYRGGAAAGSKTAEELAAMGLRPTQQGTQAMRAAQSMRALEIEKILMNGRFSTQSFDQVVKTIASHGFPTEEVESVIQGMQKGIYPSRTQAIGNAAGGAANPASLSTLDKAKQGARGMLFEQAKPGWSRALDRGGAALSLGLGALQGAQGTEQTSGEMFGNAAKTGAGMLPGATLIGGGIGAGVGALTGAGAAAGAAAALPAAALTGAGYLVGRTGKEAYQAYQAGQQAKTNEAQAASMEALSQQMTAIRPQILQAYRGIQTARGTGNQQSISAAEQQYATLLQQFHNLRQQSYGNRIEGAQQGDWGWTQEQINNWKSQHGL